jgi:putative CocE/NonD family hydrolase
MRCSFLNVNPFPNLRLTELILRSSAAWLFVVCLPTPSHATPVLDGKGAPYFNIVVEHDVAIPMRDGIVLRATLLRPDAPGRFPALVYRTPYNKAVTIGTAAFPHKAARHGYLVFLVDVRGRYASEGTFQAYRDEKQDGYDTIEWVAAHHRANGRVGTWGFSYPGFVQWLALSQDPPHLFTAVPAMTPTGSHHFFYQGGAFYHAFLEWFMPSILPDQRRRAGDKSGPWDGRTARNQWAAERRQWYAHRPLVGLPHLERYAPCFSDWLRHPDKTDWWDFADVEKDYGKMRVPVLLVSGWYDSSYGTVGAVRGFQGMREKAATNEAREKTKLILGPWTHSSLDVFSTRVAEFDFGPNAGLDYDALLLRWFDRRLNRIDNGVDAEPPVRIFVMGENRWRTEEEFPLKRARMTPLYLYRDISAGGADGYLAFDAPTTDLALSRYTFDPHDPIWEPNFVTGRYDQAALDGRDDLIKFTTEPLDDEIEVTGEVTAELYVASDARDTDFAVTFCDVHPDGTAHSLTGPEAGYLRMRYRNGYEGQTLMESGKVYKIRIGGLLTANLFRRRHRIQIIIASSRVPHFDPNPNTGEEIATATRLVPAKQILYHDRNRPSQIILPVVPRN